MKVLNGLFMNILHGFEELDFRGFMSSYSSLFRDLLTRAFIAPWRDVGRARVLLLGVTGGFSVSILGFSISFHMAQQGMMAATYYALVVLLVGGLVLFPCSFLLMRGRYGWVRIVLTQLVGAAILLIQPSHAVLVGAGAVLLQHPFWASYHFRFSIQRSFANHGAETALAALIFMWAGAAGAFAAGAFLQTGGYIWCIALGSGLLIFSTLLLLPHGAVENVYRTFRRILRRRKLSARLSGFSGAACAAMDYALPAWLLIMGVSPLVSGFMLGARPLLGLVLTPIIGRMVQRGSRQALVVGAVCIVLAWLEIGTSAVLGLPSYVFLVGLALLATGNTLVGTAEVSRWYKMRSASGVFAREVALTTGRLPTLLISFPLVFIAPLAYPLVGGFFACLLILEAVTGGRWFYRRRALYARDL